MTGYRPFSELVALMEREQHAPQQDKLDKITDKMREARDLKLHCNELEEKLKEAKKQLLSITQRDLPDLMNEVNQGTFKLLAEGNHPSYTFNLKPFYKATIDNDKETSLEAYQWLEQHGEGDIIKRTVTAVLGKESRDLQDQLVEMCEQMGIDYETKYSVPWNTLTAWLKERHNLHMKQIMNGEDEVIDMPPLDIFGATIGQVAEMKESK